MSYTNEDARFDYEAMHGDACTRHGDAHCTRCCIECGRPRPCPRHDEEDEADDEVDYAAQSHESDWDVP